MNTASEKRLAKLHPTLATTIRKIAGELAGQGIAIEVVQGYRTFEEQQALYAKGRTAPGDIVTQAKGGESNHNYGLAADLCPFVDGKPQWNAPIETWVKIGRTAEGHGLEWGGSWKKFVDKPHVQLANMTVKTCQTCFGRGGLEQVWAEATRRCGLDIQPAAAGAGFARPSASARPARAGQNKPRRSRTSRSARTSRSRRRR